MFVKRFVASDMQEAVQKIKKEFGPDAVILDSKTVRAKGLAGLFKKKIEVVAAFEPRRDAETAMSAPPPKPAAEKKSVAAAAAPMAPKADDIQIEPLAAQIESLKGMVADITNRIRSAAKDPAATVPLEAMGLYADLVERDVNDDIARDIAITAHGVSARQSVPPETVAQQIVADRLGQPMPIKIKRYKQTVLLFAGPTGAGKTTTLVKLAGRLALEQNLSIGLVNMDTYRVGAMEHMRIYADIMDIPLKTAYTAAELEDAVASMADRDVVLIDTAGQNASSPDYQKDLEAFIAASHADEVYLVISVATGSKVCRDILRHYAFIPDYKLIVTKLDEVSAWGNILNIAAYSKKPFAYVTTGQNVPDDISEADPCGLAGNIVPAAEVDQ